MKIINIPENATVGDVIKIVFPGIDYEINGYAKLLGHKVSKYANTVDLFVNGQVICILEDNWNAPYSRINCKFRNPENGNCMEVGGFCLTVDDKYCKLKENN